MEYRFSDRCKNLEGNAIREIFKLLSTPGIISFAGGLPANGALPREDIRAIMSELLSDESALPLLQYGATEGYKPYLEACLKYAERVGIFGKEITEVLAVSGGQQGIDLTCKAFLNKGDVVLVEDPTYLAALHIVKTYEGKAVGVKSGESGMDLEDLEEKILAYKPKFVYIVPTFSNPTGITMPAAKRKALAEMTAKYGVMVLEDNPYGELRYAGTPVDAIKSYDTAGNVIYLSSFSKVISPGLRVGFAIADAAVIRKLTIGKQATDVHTATLNQATAAEYLNRGLLDPALQKSIPSYREKMFAMLAALEKYFPKTVSYTKPEGGLFVWVTLPANADAQAMFPKAVEKKVAYVTGDAFFADGSGKNTMRLNFSNATLEQIDTGIRALGELLKQELEIRN